MHQHLGAVTDPGADGAHQRLAGAGVTRSFGAQHAVPRGHRPVRGPGLGRHCCIVALVQSRLHGWGAGGGCAMLIACSACWNCWVGSRW